jgi:predicted RNase H-like HicB family nuclease
MSKHTLHNEFTAIIERDGKWHIGYCPEIPGANGQGETVEECKKNLADAIALILQDRREDAQRGLPADAVQDVVSLS